MRVTVDRHFPLQVRSQTVLARDSEIWTYGDTTKKLLRYTVGPERALAPAAPLPSISVKDAALSWDGHHLIAADRSSRKVYRVDSASNQESLVVDPTTLDFGNFDPALTVVDAVIGDVAWHDGLLYLAVQAGYSSAIYGIDPANKRVVSHRRAPGPKPSGLDFDPEDGALYTVDSRNREIRRYTRANKEDVAELPAELTEPKGLSFDTKRGLWSVDWSTGKVLRLNVKE